MSSLLSSPHQTLPIAFITSYGLSVASPGPEFSWMTGLVVTVIQFVRREPAWPFAAGALVLCVVAVGLGGVGYAMAVG